MKNFSSSTDEVRGVWIASVVNIDFPSSPSISVRRMQKELDEIVANASRIGFNNIYFQVRPACDALYRSALFPASVYLTGNYGGALPEDFDPLQYLLTIAHDAGIRVHAWVNPLRVTMGTPEQPMQDPAALAPGSPARLHPEWTVPYSDGKLYLNAGLPEVRDLIAAGVKEIVAGYPVDGVIFDDYFYPYPGPGGEFDDSAAFAQYGSGFDSRGDWRRSNINAIVRGCYRAVKEANPSAQFGISPFGIWRNDDGANGGSETAGLSACDAIYCDALAWIREGTVDYIAPQLYWKFDFEVARFDTLTRWWNAQLAAYPQVRLLICHAAYRSGPWEDDTEIRRQILFAREMKSYGGGIMYGYQAIVRNDENLIGQLQACYGTPHKIPIPVSDKSPVTIGSPASEQLSIDCDHAYLIGHSDPGLPLTCNGKPVSQTVNGYFGVFLKLPVTGENRFLFRQEGGASLCYSVIRQVPEPEAVSDGDAGQENPSERLLFPAPVPVRVVSREARLKPSPDSSYYEDAGFAVRGMTAAALGTENGCYLLSCGLFLPCSDAERLPDAPALSDRAQITGGAADYRSDRLSVRILCSQPVPVTVSVADDGMLRAVLYGASLLEGAQTVCAVNPLCGGFALRQENENVILSLPLYDARNYYGYDLFYEEGTVGISLRCPHRIGIDPALPLAGVRLLLDPGHGGDDTGAPGPDRGYREKDFNLAIVRKAVPYLSQWGAEVFTTRSDDASVPLVSGEHSRCAVIDALRPDLVFSVHHDSIGYYADITKLHGLLSLYWDPSGRLAAETAFDQMTAVLGRKRREVRRQCLAMCRNPHVPAVLVEAGYTTCPEEMSFARTEEGAEKAGAAVAYSILAYFKTQDDFLRRYLPEEGNFDS